jgi:formylglycine-generating enzyme
MAQKKNLGLIFLVSAAFSLAFTGVDAAASELKMVKNSVGMAFVLVPAGSFLMGSPTDEPFRDKDEAPHKVTLTKPFYIQTTEVTEAQWHALMKRKWFGRRTGGDLPVVKVSWYDCMEFVEKLNRLGEGRYRLPTEAEWEYACRAGTTTPYSFGVHEGFQLQEYAWFVTNCSQAQEPYAHAVGTRKPNPWGLHDMHGNLWEFCSDWYGAYPFPDDGPVTDPKGPETGSTRVVRGGAYDSRDYQTRSATRYWRYTNVPYGTVGIRLVRDHVAD